MGKLKVLVVGYGNMGASHARAYYTNSGFELVGIVSRRSSEKRQQLAEELGNVSQFNGFDEALQKTIPDVVSINSYTDTHKEYAIKSLHAGAHVFVEKPLAETVREAQEIIDLAKDKNKKVVVGYILRQHPAWKKFITISHTLGTPLVMRMNLNQQSSGAEWETHKHLMKSTSPIVDCGVHYVDVMCQMTQSKPISVHAIGVKLTDEIDDNMYNYGQLQVTFENGSVGWYEAGWGPMMSETAFFVKDVIGPKGCVSILEQKASDDQSSSTVDDHTKTNQLLVHSQERDADGKFVKKDEFVNTADEPDHQGLCDLEQAYLLEAILNDLDLGGHLNDALGSMKIVLAADESIRTGKVVFLKW